MDRLLILLSVAAGFADVLVTIPDGTIRGHILQTSKAKQSYYAFQGIPYATPPLGKLRFEAPTSPQKWTGTLNATKESNECYQVKDDSPKESEDCLYINVFTPQNPANIKEKLPVMFWIYGGAFRGGSSGFSTYGPDYFIEQGIIIVTSNYRVGPFGFLSTGDLIIPGNAGLKDQAFALKWTNQNIEKFGGDPSKITIFGQSAGSASVGYQILSPLSAGLFRAAIAESGSPLDEWAYLDQPKAYALDLANKVSSGSFSESNSTSLKQYLQNADASVIDQASKTTTIKLALPVVEPDHDGAFITKPMYQILDAGEFNKVPLIIGINSEEEVILAHAKGSLKVLARGYDSDLSSLVPAYLNLVAGTNKESLGQLIRTIYVGADAEFQNNLGPMIRYYSDNGFTRGIIKQGKLHSKYADVYFYQFSYDGELGGWNETIEGAETVSHGEDLKYLFVRRGNPDTTDLSKYPAADVLTHERMVQMWSNFAKTMNPTPEKSELLQNVIWPKVNADNYQYLNINVSLAVQTNPKGSYFQKWETIFNKYGVDFVTY